MKSPLMAVLALSLAGNAVLAVMALRTEPSSPTRQDPPASTAATTSQPSPAKTRPAEANANAKTPIDNTVWSRIKPGDDLHAMVANLRSAGFPPSVIRSVVYQMVADKLAAKNPTANDPYWKRQSPSKERMVAMQALNNERQALIESLLGPDGKRSAMLTPEARAREYGSIPPEKIDAIQQIEKDYSDMRNLAFASRTPGNMQNMMQQQEVLEKEKSQDLAALLTPEELEQFEMRQSRSAQQLMSMIRNVDISEDEYTALFRMQKAVDAAAPQSGVMNSETMATRMAAQRKMHEEARGLLGEERFYQYMEGADPMFGMVKNFTSKYSGISSAATYQVYELQQLLQSQMMGPNRTASGEDRVQVLAGFNQKLDAILGAEVAAEYRKEGGGRMFAMPTAGGQRVLRIDGGP